MISHKKKIIGSLGISLIIICLFSWLVTLPLLTKIKQLSQDYLISQETLAKLDQRDFLFRDLERSYQSKQEQLANIERAFLTQKETVGFIATLENVAQATDNIFEIKTAETFTNDEEENGEAFLSLNISLWGDFESLLLFLANLEDSPYPPYRLLEIDSLSIYRLEGDNVRSGDLETILGIKIYTQ